MTIDSDLLFNGSPERYNWKSLGKRQMYIPANAYKVHQPTVKYADLLKKNHANPGTLSWQHCRYGGYGGQAGAASLESDDQCSMGYSREGVVIGGSVATMVIQ